MTVRSTLAATGVSQVTFARLRAMLRRLAQNETLNFVATNQLLPRQLVTRWFGWFSQIEQPLVRDLSLATWRMFTDLDLSDASTQEFASLHACFIRELAPGARPVDLDADTVTSPCDGIVVMCGEVQGTRLFQVKGSSYDLRELLIDPALAEQFRDGCYVTLRLTSAMYHRLHAPYDCTVEHVTYVAGDTWNTHPATLQRVPKLYCKNERAILRARLRSSGKLIAIVPVAAILVASIRLHFLDVLLRLQHPGPNELPCFAELTKGEELGYFQHGSTVVLFAPRGFSLATGVRPGSHVRMGQALLRLPSADAHSGVG
jgi:phosphatidylserine decarboxylase